MRLLNPPWKSRNPVQPAGRGLRNGMVEHGRTFHRPRVALLSVFDEIFLGLRSIGAMLKQHGYYCAYITFKMPQEHDTRRISDAELRDEEYNVNLSIRPEELDILSDLLKKLKIDLLGITTASTFHLQARLITRLVRERLGIPVIWGGADTILNPDLAIREADAVCLGDGETAMLEIAEAIKAGKDFGGVAGTWSRNGDIVRKNPARPFIEDLDSLPFFDWDLTDYYAVTSGRLVSGQWAPGSFVNEKRVFTMTGRGCPMRCSYCFNGAPLDSDRVCHKLRRRSVDSVIRELRGIKRQRPGLDQIHFADEIFTRNRSWVFEFAARYKKEIGVPFVCYTYPKSPDKEILSALTDAGLRHILLGVQSGSDRTNRELYNRPAGFQDIMETAQVLHDLGHDYIIELIVGNPLEREEDYRQSLRLLQQLPRPYSLAGLYRLFYFRNYALTLEAQKAGAEMEHLNPVTSIAKTVPEYAFWFAMYYLASSHPFSEESLRFLLDTPEFRARPEPLLEISLAMNDSLFYKDHETSRMKKDHYIGLLQRDLSALKGSRAVRLYQRFKRICKPETNRIS